MAEGDRARDYKLSDKDADTLIAAALVPADMREKMLKLYVMDHGADALLSMFAQFIGLANSVVANQREMLEVELMVEAGYYPNMAEQFNFPNIFGALNGVKLANAVDPKKGVCEGCAFRLGSHANQSPSTTVDADYCAKDSDHKFMCHMEMEEGEPKRICGGYAQMKKQAERSGIRLAE